MYEKYFNKQLCYSKFIVTLLILAFSVVENKAVANSLISETKLVETTQQNTIPIKGTVVDVLGTPVIGATIMEKGTSNGTMTDIDGNFTINVQPGSVIVISYIGFHPQELKATENMKIELIEDAKYLDEVVVMGYGVQKKKLVTGATVQVKGDDIARLNTVNVLEALQSQAAGVNIVQTSGFLGAGFKVTIRGLGTNGAASPLYVVDGVAGGSLDGLNPNDIESVDILKDAASAAIYGARAANGIVLVTTKRGKAGTFNTVYEGFYGAQNLYKIPTILTAKEYMTMQDEGRVMDGLSPYNWAQYLPAHDLEAIENGSWKGTNWLKEILNKNAPIQSHSLNFAGGTERSTFSIGLTYLRQEATMGVPNATPVMDRYNARVNSDHVIIKKGNLDMLRIGQTLNYKYQEMQGSVATSDIYWNAVHNMLIMSPLMHVYNADGDYYVYEDRKRDGYEWDISNGADKNPIAYLDYLMNQNKSRSHYLQSSFNATLQPIKNLRLKTQFGYIMAFSSYRSYIPAYGYLTASLISNVDRVTQSMSNSHRWTWDNTANYVFEIDGHNLDLLAGQSFEKWGMGESLGGSNQESSFYDFEHAYLSNVPGTGNVQSLTGSPNSPGAIASFFGRANYNYKERYMGSFIIRADGSSTFARGNRWGYFPSLSAGWNVTNENFMSGVNWLEFLKLRTSWGQNGNCMVSPFQYLSTISSNNTWGGYPFGDNMGDAATGSYAYRLTNPDLKWETSEQTNIGIDARFLRGRLGVELDWYTRTAKDWLVTAPVLASFGADPVSVNGGNVRNRGFEVTVHWNGTANKEFDYGANLSLGYNKNEVIKIANADGIIHGPASVFWEGAEECFRAEVGKPFGYFYGYKSDGIFQNQKQIDEYKGALLNGAKTQPGDVIWRDVNNDGVIDADDRTMIGNPHPDFTLGFLFNVGWKGFDLSVVTFTALGQQIMKCYRDFSSSPLNNYTTDIYNRWHGEGTSNKYPRLASASSTNWARISDLYVENGDYLKIKNVTLGYDFKKVFKNLPMQQLRLYLTAQNLFTFTKYSGMDPEVGYGSDYSWASGIDLGFYPSARTYMVGASIKF